MSFITGALRPWQLWAVTSQLSVNTIRDVIMCVWDGSHLLVGRCAADSWDSRQLLPQQLIAGCLPSHTNTDTHVSFVYVWAEVVAACCSSRSFRGRVSWWARGHNHSTRTTLKTQKFFHLKIQCSSIYFCPPPAGVHKRHAVTSWLQLIFKFFLPLWARPMPEKLVVITLFPFKKLENIICLRRRPNYTLLLYI